jgi:hypothetical protein
VQGGELKQVYFVLPMIQSIPSLGKLPIVPLHLEPL